MAKSLKSVLAKLLVAGMLATLALSACSKRPNAEQLRALEEARKAALAAEDLLAQKQRERDNLKRQVEQKRAELAKAQAEKAAVAKRLGQ